MFKRCDLVTGREGRGYQGYVFEVQDKDPETGRILISNFHNISWKFWTTPHHYRHIRPTSALEIHGGYH